MENNININGRIITYKLKRARGLRGLRLSIRPWGEITVTTGLLTPQFFIDSTLKSKSDWLITTLEKLAKKNISPPIVHTPQEIKAKKKQTLIKLDAKLDYFGPMLGVTWNKITIRNQSTRWGSCSRDGNLNFNYRLGELPDELFDYVVVHELAHLKQMNHSPKFWAIVESILPNHKLLRKNLHKFSLSVG